MSEPRLIDALVAEIGSTTTVVSAFDGLAEYPASLPVLLGQGMAPTTVDSGDVGEGLAEARAALEAELGPVGPRVILATSSAAGGLRMTVHGLTEKMTAMAAREAALGAGARVELLTAGRLRDSDLARIDAIRPNVILLAGGVEGGDSETILHNAERLAALAERPIVIYGGNSAARDDACALLETADFPVRITRNVYPAVDELDIVPARAVIHDAFEEHIIHAPGMGAISELVTGRVLPTPGAVLLAAEALGEHLGDLVVVDVGGATTDVHSVTDGSLEIAPLLSEPQPHVKRTVEGDLGTYVSARHVVEAMLPAERPDPLPPAVPTTDAEIAAAATLARACTEFGLRRHAGSLVNLYTPSGRKTIARGRDLTAVRTLVGTGGALTRLPGGIEALRSAIEAEQADLLMPPSDAECVLDRDYLFGCCGALLSEFDREAVVRLMLRSIGKES